MSKVKETLHKVLTAIVVAVNVAVCAFAISVSYAGCFDPTPHPVVGVMPMLVPAAIAAIVLIIIIDLIAWRRTAIAAAVCLLICLPQMLKVVPLNVGGNRSITGEEEVHSWSLLTMNVTNFQDITGKYAGDVNPTISYVLSADADVVCLQETNYLCPDKNLRITQAQVDSVTSRYPYVLINNFMMVLSKYEIKHISLNDVDNTPGVCTMDAYRLYIDGKPVTIFNLHLRSYSLTDSDKQIFHGLSHITREKISEARHSVLTKLSAAAVDRATQAKHLVRYLKKYGGENAIVCGDFNDVSGCYTMHLLADEQMKDAFASMGFGYMHTFHSNRFYFCIDHIMWRGNFDIVQFSRDKIPYSDHYPLRATFLAK